MISIIFELEKRQELPDYIVEREEELKEVIQKVLVCEE